MHRIRQAVLLVALVAAAACSNSGAHNASNDGSPNTTTAGTPARAEGDRHTFVDLTGVPGVDDDSITFDAIGVQSNNPLGTCILDCYVKGIEAYFDYRNAEGGLYGRELRVGAVLDDELTKNKERALEVVSAKSSFGVFQAPLIPSGYDTLDEAGVPTFSWGVHNTAVAGRMSIFPSIAPTCQDCTVRGVPYAVHHTGGTRVASLGYGAVESSAKCAQASNDSIDRYGADIGAEAAYVNDDLDYGLPNGIAPQVSAMRDAGVDFIVACLDLNGMKSLAEELRRQDMDKVPMYHLNSYNQQFIADSDGLFEGDIVAAEFLPFEATPTPALSALLSGLEAAGTEPTELATVGWINADAAYTALLAAGPDFDRASVISAMNAITDFDAGGLIVPIDWTRQHSPPSPDDYTNAYTSECRALVQVVHGTFETVAPPDKPFLCWSNDDLSWSEPVPTTFGG